MARDINNENYEFDPVKELKGGVEASKVVWSTNSFNAAVDALSKGLPLKANPFCGNNTKLLKPDLVYKRTPEEVEDVIRCMQDPLYFASKCFLMTPEGLQQVKMRDYQEEYLTNLKENRFNILLAARQSGKSVTTAIFGLWKILFASDRNGLILSKSGAAGRDLLKKIKDMYLYLPYHLKCGTLKWNQSEISFDNNSSLKTEAFSSTAGVGSTLNLVILDEFAWCPANEVQLFYENVIPTVTTMPDSNVCICSTQNGFNKFYEIYQGAVTGKSIYHAQKIDWWQVPNWNTKTKQWEKRTEAWKEMMVGVLGSEEAFYYQYGTQFSASDVCLVSREALSRRNTTEVLFESLKDDDLFISELKYFKIHPDFKLEYFKDPKRSFIVLVDLAEGGGADYTVFNIFEITIENNKPVFSQVAYWSSNVVDIEKSSLVFWVLFNTILSQQNTIVSIEWNTYGALFYNYLTMLNEPTMFEEYNFRLGFGQELDLSIIVHYKKGQNDEDIAGIGSFKNSKTIPGIRWSAITKRTGCALLKMSIEGGETRLYDIVQIGELENFEDKNGNGSYKASYGHDDMMMTLVQIPMLKQTARFKDFIEEINERRTLYTEKNLLSDRYDPFGAMTEINFGNNIPW